jgi:hypothetical protein
LKEVEQELRGIPKSGLINKSYIFEKLCRNFSIRKGELMLILIDLRDLGLIEISTTAIKLSYKIKNGE